MESLLFVVVALTGSACGRVEDSRVIELWGGVGL